MIESRDPAPTPPAPAAGPEPPRAETSSTPTPVLHRWWLVPALLVAAFLLLLWQVKSHGPVTGLDIRVRDRIQDWAARPGLRGLAVPGRDLANLGNQSIALSALFAATAVAVRVTRSWWPVIAMVAAWAALLTVIPLKLAIGRPGPGQVVLGDAALGFFPSGHTADSILCYATAALLLCALIPPAAAHARAAKRAIAAAAATLVALTIFGLLWSDYHWLSDTVASLCWCGAGLLVVRRLIRDLAARHPRSR
jgi:hypothetical protein